MTPGDHRYQAPAALTQDPGASGTLFLAGFVAGAIFGVLVGITVMALS